MKYNNMYYKGFPIDKLVNDNRLIYESSKDLDALIKSLFADGTQGVYLNAQDDVSVSDLSSIKDLSGRNNHALQANSTSRATLITDPSGYKSLKFDGIDDGYVTQSIDFTSTDKVTVIAAVRKLSDAAIGTLVHLSTTSANNGTFYLYQITASRYQFLSYGTLASTVTYVVNPAPLSSVLTGVGDISVDISKLRVNGVQVSSASTDQGTGKYGNYPLYIGRRAGTSSSFNGQIYALLVIGKLLDDATTQRIEKEFAKYIGVTL